MNRFKIIGISVVTSNQNGQSLDDLENLWEEFWENDIQNQISNRLSDNIYAVYTDYENAYEANYTAIVGFLVKTLDDIPKGFVGREITVGEHKKYLSQGKMPDALIATWAEIVQEKELHRAFRADVTIYSKKYFDRENAEAETFISIEV
jgi:predicted transcriptional regulator YdeE